MNDPYDLQRFLRAQHSDFRLACAELRLGRKTSHWMWYIFPQIAGLGYSQMSRRFAIKSKEEALAYLAHPVLGARLKECTDIVNTLQGCSVEQIFGSPDDIKFSSCMTLFHRVSPEDEVFEKALAKYFNGALDQQTLERMRATGSART